MKLVFESRDERLNPSSLFIGQTVDSSQDQVVGAFSSGMEQLAQASDSVRYASSAKMRQHDGMFGLLAKCCDATICPLFSGSHGRL